MAHTFSQIYIQIVFAVKGRKCLIAPEWEERMYQYITGVIRKKDQKLIAINGMPDHIHILIGMQPDCNLSALVREVKKTSNAWVNDCGRVSSKFQWQEGFGAFSYGQSQLSVIANYVMNQKIHHTKKSFKKEYLEFLERFEIDQKGKRLFEWYDD